MKDMRLISLALVFGLLCNISLALQLTIQSPASLAGPMEFSPSMFGTMPGPGGLTAALVDVQPFDACQPLRNVSSAGLAIAGKLALIYANGNCMLGDKAKNAQAAGAAGVVMYGCSPFAPDFCPDDLIVPLAFNDPASPFLIPTIMLTYWDGIKLLRVLQNSPNVTVTLNVPGSGPVSPSDLVSLRQLYQAFFTANGNAPLQFNGYGTSFDISGGLAPWDRLLNGSAFDPCVTRAYGVYCIDGRIVWLNCNSCGASGTLPDVIGSLTALKYLDFSVGNALTGELPCTIGNLQNLTAINIATNQITGLSNCFGSLTKLISLNAAANKLVNLPPQLNQLTSLQNIVLRDNAITFVPSLNSLRNLATLDLSNNKIAVPIWSFNNLTNLKVVDLHANRFFGSMPPDTFDNLPQIKTIDLSQNQFTGSLPNLDNCPGITSLSFQFNSFTNTVPTVWSRLQNLKYVSVSHNQLISPCRAFFLMTNLETVDLSHNNLTTYAVDPTGFEWRDEVGAFVSFTVPLVIRSANLANNQLTGIFSPGWLTAPWPNLEQLSIANNYISGTLPVDMFNMPAKKLNSLDFSGNQWVGSIPQGSPARTLTMLKLSNSPQLRSESSSVPSFAKASQLFVKDPSGLFACPQLVSSDPTITLAVTVDPTYYDYSLCRCERGYTSGGSPPFCAAFPSLVLNNQTVDGTLSDGSSSGRLRTGADTRWVIQPVGEFRVINIVLTLFNPEFMNGTSKTTKTSYQVNVDKGKGLFAGSQVFYFTSNMFGPGVVSKKENIHVIDKTATLHFFSDSEDGPHFHAVYNTSMACPAGYRIDPTGSTCEVDVYVEPAELSKSAQIGLMACIGFCLVLSLVYTALLVRFKSHRVVHAASPLFCFIFTFGINLLFVAAFLMVQEQSPMFCQLQAWFFNLGFTLAYGSLFIKTWRLHKIFNNKNLTSTKITDSQLLIQLGLFVCVDCAILLAWNFQSPAYLRSVAQKECLSSHGMIYTIVLCCEKGIVLLMGSYLTYQVQKLPSQFNESKYMAAATYNTILMSLIWIGVILGIGSQLSISTRTLIQTVLIILGGMFTEGLLLVPKYLVIFTDQHSLDPDQRRVSQFTPSMMELVTKTSGSSATAATSESVAAILASQAAARIAKLSGELDKMRNDYDSQCAKYKNAEENLRKSKDKIEEMEHEMADRSAELEYLRDINGITTPNTSQISPDTSSPASMPLVSHSTPGSSD